MEHCNAIFTYELQKSNDAFENANVKLWALTNFTSLVKTSLQKKFITKTQLNHIMDWKKNPEGWVDV